jgi:hypothetical protein
VREAKEKGGTENVRVSNSSSPLLARERWGLQFAELVLHYEADYIPPPFNLAEVSLRILQWVFKRGRAMKEGTGRKQREGAGRKQGTERMTRGTKLSFFNENGFTKSGGQASRQRKSLRRSKRRAQRWRAIQISNSGFGKS